MFKSRIGLAVMAILIASAVLAPAATTLPPGVTKEDMKHIMPMSQLKIGMKGYGLTVFKGVKIEKFQVEILGFLRTWNLGRDLILVKMSGGPITTRKTRLMHGMSGSPVFINGKIIGATAWGMQWSQEPICMITPIEDMLYSLDTNLPTKPSGLSSEPTPLSSPIKVDGKTYNSVEMRQFGSKKPAPKGTMVVTPLATPVMVSGLSNKNMEKLAEIFEPYGLVPMAGPNGKSDVVPCKLEPGSSVGMAIGTGDVDMAAIGTVTYCRGNKLIAFGHPFLSIGPIDAPMLTAYVFDCFPSVQDSVKIAGVMKEVGRVFQDMPFSIAGEIGGPKAKMVPITVDVNDKVTKVKHTFHVDLINHPLMTPQLLLAVAPQGVGNVQMMPGDCMATVKTTVVADQIGKIERTNTYFAPYAIEMPACTDLAAILKILAQNPYYPLDVKSVNMSVEINHGHKTADIERIFVDKNHYEPGDTITVGVEMRPYKAEKFTKYVKITVPENTPDGKLTLRVNGGTTGGEETAVTLSPDADGARATPLPEGTADNTKQMIQKLLEKEKNNDLIVRLLLTSADVTISGQKFPNLPESLASVMKSPKTTGLKLERSETKSVVSCDCIPLGGQSMSVTIQKKHAGERKAGSATQTQPKKEEKPAVQQKSAMATPTMSVPAGFGAGPSAPKTEAKTEPKTATKTEVKTETKTEQKTEVKTEEKTEAKPEQKSEPKAAEKPVNRQPDVWQQNTLKDFGAGEFVRTTATDGDDVRMVPSLTKLASLPEDYVWQIVADGKGGAYAGTGNNGYVYHVDKSGSSSVFFKTSDLEVQSLACGPDGTLYAGTSPGGKVFRITSDGRGQAIFTAKEKYITALAVDSKGNIYAGTGDTDKIYKISPEGHSSTFANLETASVLSLAVDSSGNVYAGTGKPGVVFKIKPNGVTAALFNAAAEESISSLVVDCEGNVYAGTGTGKGMIYKIPANGTPKPVFDRGPHSLALVVDKQNNIYTVSDESIYKILPDETTMALDLADAAAQFVALAIDDNGTIFAGATNTGAIYRSSPASQGTYQSVVHDAGLRATWCNISWVATTPEGTSVTLETRSGNTADPDNTWSAWSLPYTNSCGQRMTSPAARYIQYRAKLNGSAACSPILQVVSVSGLTDNRAPQVSVTDPQTGGIIARTSELKWSGNDPDKDTLTYDLYYSANCKNWIPLGSDFKQVTTEPEKKEEQAQGPPQPGQIMSININGPDIPNPDDMLAQLKTEIDNHPEIPAEVKQKLLADAPAAIKAAVDAAKAKQAQPAAEKKEETKSDEPKKNTTKQTSYSWDTTKVPDGYYYIKVVVSDKSSNAADCLTGEKVVGPVAVANKQPRVIAAQTDVVINPDHSVTTSGYAYSDTIVALVGVQYKVDDDDWMAAASKDGACQSMSEAFCLTTKQLAKGKHTIEVKAIDAAGNGASVTLTVEIP